MKNKNIILYLIIQELKYTQLISGLQRLGLNTDNYVFSLLEVIQPLLEVPMNANESLPEVSDDLSKTYDCFIVKAEDFDIDSSEQELEQLAEACYQALVVQIRHENKQIKVIV